MAKRTTGRKSPSRKIPHGAAKKPQRKRKTPSAKKRERPQVTGGSASTTKSALQEELESELANYPARVLVIVGAGVSIASTNNNESASWLGLLRNGVDYCKSHLSGLPLDWAKRMHAQLKSGDLTEMISVAENISTRLDGPTGGDYARWLSATVGALPLASPRLIEAITGWKVQIATTNYDDLIEKITAKSAITWMEKSSAIQFFRGEISDVFHLHGFWRSPRSVILGVRSYERILNDEGYQFLLQALLMGRTVVFVGCGAGMQDPNFSTLLEWSKRVLRESPHQHYRLARRTEVAECQKQHPSGSRIAILEYGDSHDDLLPFLEAITKGVRAKRAATPVATDLATAQGDFDQRRSDLEAKKQSLAIDQYFRSLFDIARELWQKGGKRTAWMMTVGTFERESSALTAEQRLQYGMELAQMMLDDNASDTAGPILHALAHDAETASIPAELKSRFWQLQARGFSDLCAYDQALQSIDRALSSSLEENDRLRLIAERAEIRMLQGDDDLSIESLREGGNK